MKSRPIKKVQMRGARRSASGDVRAWSGPLDPVIPRERKGFNSRAIIDATRPFEWRDKFPAVNAVSDEFKDRLDEKYASVLKEVLQRAH